MNWIDLHCDTLMAFADGKLEDRLYSNDRCIDIKRMKKSGILAQFFAVWMPEKEDFTLMHVPFVEDDMYIEYLLGGLKYTCDRHSDMIAFTTSADRYEKNKAAGKISAFLTLESGRAVNGDLERIKAFYEMGVRLITLTWNLETCFGFPHSPDPLMMGKGLSTFGKEAIEVMNELGMLIDVSHLSEKGFWDVAEISKKPFLASHSNARSLSPHSRNLTDDQIRCLAENGGIIGLNFVPQFLRRDMARTKSRVQDMVSHAIYIKNTGGADCLALGSDFDGFEGESEITSHCDLENLWYALKRAGFSEPELDKFSYGNAERLIRHTL